MGQCVWSFSKAGGERDLQSFIPATEIRMNFQVYIRLRPLERELDAAPWMGVRPAMPEMLSIIGPAPGASGLWCAFGHGHQGLTNGPATGRMISEMMAGERPFIDPTPYRPERFWL